MYIFTNFVLSIQLQFECIYMIFLTYIEYSNFKTSLGPMRPLKSQTDPLSSQVW